MPKVSSFRFDSGIVVPNSSRPRKRSYIAQVDQFAVSEFFFTKDGVLSDRDLFLRSEADPELRAKLQESLVEQDVQSELSDDVSLDEAFARVQSRYETKYDVLKRLNARIADAEYRERLQVALDDRNSSMPISSDSDIVDKV